MPHTDTIKDWLISNDLYEENLFFYTLIIIFWFFVGFVCLGFELEGFSLQQNLFFNFVFYLFICAMMALCPFWFKLFFRNHHNNRRQEWFDDAFSKLDDEDRQLVTDYLQATGHFVKQPLQRWSLIFLGSYFLFEIFFISAWVKDLALVWEPRWATALIEWAISHTNVPPLNVDRDLFGIDIKDDSFPILNYDTDTDFLQSEHGRALMLFHCFRAVTFFLILTCFYHLLWKLVSNEITNISPKNIDTLFKFMTISFLTFMAFLMAVAVFFAFFEAVNVSNLYMQHKASWIYHFWLMIGYLFVLCFIRLAYDWCIFWRRVWEYIA